LNLTPSTNWKSNGNGRCSQTKKRHVFLFSGYDIAMNMKRDSAKDVTGDFEKFKDFARQVLSVPHSEIKEKLDAEREAKRTPRVRASRVSVSRSKPV